MSAVSMLLYMSQWHNSGFPNAKAFHSSSGISPAKQNSELYIDYTAVARINGIEKTVTLRDLIEWMQVSQKSWLIQQEYERNTDDYNGLIKALRSVHEESRNPVLIGIGMDRGDSRGLTAHALVGYDYYENSSGDIIVKVYDPNIPCHSYGDSYELKAEDCQIILYKDNSGIFGGWSYKMRNDVTWGTEVESKSTFITYVPYDTIYKTWSQISGSGPVPLPDDRVLLTVGYDKSVSAVSDFCKFSINGYYGNHIYDIEGPLAEDVRSKRGYVTNVWLDADAYKIINEEMDGGTSNSEWTLSVVQKDQAVYVKTDAREVYVYLSDSDRLNAVEIAEPNKSFSIELYSSFKNADDVGEPDLFYGGITPSDVSIDSPLSIVRYKGERYLDYVNSQEGKKGAHTKLKELIEPVPIRPQGISENSPFYESVIWAMNLGITQGYGEQIINGIKYVDFRPGSPCSRQAILKFLWSYEGCPEPEIPCPFEDVTNSDLQNAASWAAELGLVPVSLRLGAADPCTRSEVMYYLWRLQGAEKPADRSSVLASFSDVSGSTLDSSHLDAIAWAVENGITNGTDASHFNPDKSCTRGQIVTFLKRMDDIYR